MKIGIVVFDGADELDFVGPYEILRGVARTVKTGNQEGQVRLLSVESQNEVVTANGLNLRPDGFLEDGDTFDIVIVPGGGWVGGAPTGVRAEIQKGILPRKLAVLHAAGAIVAGVCTGAMALAAAGLLDGRPAITHRGAIEDLRAAGAQVVQARVVDAGTVITCGGVTASLDLALWLIERFWSVILADKAAELLEYTRNRHAHVARESTSSAR